MARQDASDLAHRLGRQAEGVCRHYLSSGRRNGGYWVVGDVRNTPGRSMYVRLKDTPNRPAGKWTDAATGEHGDLLDVIRESCGLIDFKDVADEARTFLSMPPPEPQPREHQRQSPGPHGSPEAARRLVRMSQPIHGTLVQAYLRERGITDLRGTGSLHFHPRCYYRPDENSPTETWPAMIAAVTDLDGKITGAHRTWLDPRRRDKAPIDTPRRAMGDLLGNAVCFGIGGDVMAAGEGIETVLSLRQVLPDMPMLAALSAAHLAAILFPDTLRRLYVVRDNDPAGDGARDSLIERANAAGIEAIVISPELKRLQRGSAHPRPGRTARGSPVAGRAAGRSALHRVGGIAGRETGVRFAALLGGCVNPSEGDRASAFERAIGPQAGQPGNGGGRLFSGAA